VDPKDPETVPLRETDLRYETEFLPDIRSGRLNSRDYLPLPDSPASVQRLQMDINSSAFHDFFRSLVTSPGKAVHQVIISVGDDLENIRLAQKIETEKREWLAQANHSRLRVKLKSLRSAVRNYLVPSRATPFT